MVSPATSERSSTPHARARSSPPALPETRRLVARIRSLATLRAIAILGGRSLVIASGIAIGTILLGKFFMWPWTGSILVAWPFLATLTMLALLAGIALGLLRTPRPLAAASMADRFSGRTDHLRAALELSERSPADPFVGILLGDAERAARACVPSKVVPMRLGRGWPLAGFLLAGAVAAAIWIPTRTIDPRRLARVPDPAAPALASEVARVAQEVRAASESAGPAISPRDAERLAELERELLDGSVRSEDARAEAAASTASLADRAEREAEQNRLAADRLADLASAASQRAAADLAANERTFEPPGADPSIGTPSLDPSSPADAGSPETESQTTPPTDPRLDELMNSLSEGDLARAAEAARQLAEQADSLSLEERARIAEQLDALAKAMDEALPQPAGSSPESTPSTPPPSETPPPQSQPADATPEQSAPDEDPIESQADAEESAARERSESIDQNAQRSAERDARSIADAAREAAEEMRRPPQPPPSQDQSQSQPQDQPPSQQQGQQQGQQRDQQPDQQPSQQQGAEQKPGNQQPSDTQQQSQQQQGQEQGQKQGQEQGAQEKNQQEGKEESQQEQGTEQGSQQPQGAEQKPGGQQQQGQEQQGAEQQEGAEQGGQQRQEDMQQQGDRPGAQEQPGLQEQPGDQPQQGPRPDQPGQPGTQPGTQPDASQRPGSGLERLQRTLREASDRNADARRQQQAAERLRQLSEELASGPDDRNPDAQQPPPDPHGGANDPSRPPDLDNLAPGASSPDAPPTRNLPRPPRAPGAAPTSIENVEGPKPTTPVGSGRVTGERPSDRPAPTEIAPITPGTLRDAASGVERAIEQQAVPDRRSDLVRRVFQRYRDRAESGPPGSSNPPDRP